jgi:hypothetical protein
MIMDQHGPEVCWTWRLLLTSIGYGWEEVSPDYPNYDIAYGSDLEKYQRSRLLLRADPSLWHVRSSLRLQEIGRCAGLSYPQFEGKYSVKAAFSMIDGRTICERDIVFDIFWLITGQDEKHWPRDKHGFFDLSGTVYFEKQVLRLALASRMASWVQKELSKLGFSNSIPRWPGNKRAAASLSHDVDYPEERRLLEPLRIIGRQGLSGLRAAISVLSGTKHHWHFSSWVQMEKEYGLRSAFYFCARKGSLAKYTFGIPDPFYDVRSPRFRRLFDFLNDEGVEIGLHASYRAFESREKLAIERQVLQQATGQQIWGNRHHYWHLRPDDSESTLLLHEEIALRYDSSLGHERYVGWRRGLSWPFFPFHQKERRELKTLQIPIAWMDDHLFGHSNDNPGNRFEILQSLVDTTGEQGGCLLVDAHNYVFDETLFPGWLKAYRWLVEHLVDRSDFWITTPGEIADHWIKRYDSIVNGSFGLSEGSS